MFGRVVFAANFCNFTVPRVRFHSVDGGDVIRLSRDWNACGGGGKRVFAEKRALLTSCCNAGGLPEPGDKWFTNHLTDTVFSSRDAVLLSEVAGTCRACQSLIPVCCSLISVWLALNCCEPVS